MVKMNKLEEEEVDGLGPEERVCAICDKEGCLYSSQFFNHFDSNQSYTDEEQSWFCDKHQGIIQHQILEFVKRYRKERRELDKENQALIEMFQRKAKKQRLELLREELADRTKALKSRGYKRWGDNAETIKQNWEDDIENMKAYIKELEE